MAMSMAYFSTGGTNPVHGRDLGPAPPSTRQLMPAGMGQLPFKFAHPNLQGYYVSLPVQNMQVLPYAGMNMGTYQRLAHAQNQTNNSNSSRIPRALPAIEPAMLAANMTNSTGGVGCEPGYNYFFPPEHTKIIVLHSQTPPWRLPPNTTFPMISCHISTKTTIAELMDGFGAIHPEKHRNSVSEVIQKGNGGWIKGLTFSGTEKKELKQTLGEVGWDKTRTGLPGQKAVVYLYFTRG